ncbi:MAG: hypothetical protein J1F63_03460 [Oscillospiraceae bacterium]|nr:hypothetical protein [Oscillospiraceae bacterium]
MKNYINPPSLSTSFSESGKSAKNRLMNILTGQKKRSGILITATVLTATLCAGAMVVFAGGESVKKPDIGSNAVTTPETDLDTAVAQAILTRSSHYAEAEFWAEGHIILGTDKVGDKTEVYAVTSIGGYSFINGAFIKDSGSGVVPAVITIDADGAAEITYPMDGSSYDESLKDMFPDVIYKELKDAKDYYPELKAQEQAQAREYLVSIGRDAETFETKYRTIVIETEICEFGDYEIWGGPRKWEMSPELSNAIDEIKKEYGLEKYELSYDIEYLEDGRRYLYYVKGHIIDNSGLLEFIKWDKDNHTIVEVNNFDIVEGKIYLSDDKSVG